MGNIRKKCGFVTSLCDETVMAPSENRYIYIVPEICVELYL